MKSSQLWFVVFAMLVLPFVGTIAQASPSTKIEWEHLLPKLPPLKDPLSGLSQDQRFDIETIEWARGLTTQQKRLVENQRGVEDAKTYEREFRKAGLDVDALLAKYRSWRQAVSKRQGIVNPEFNGKAIRMAGYLLPLEISDQGVTDFLLVPYVGACIHVPPPPPNQIVFVRLSKRFKVDDLFTAVWVSGKLKTKATSKALTLIDGTVDISIGYHIDGGHAEIYRE